MIPKTERNFSSYFSSTKKAQLQKSSTWWRNRVKTFALNNGIPRSAPFSSHCWDQTKLELIKEVPGRCLQRPPGVVSLYAEQLSEFERWSSAGLKFNPVVMQSLVMYIVRIQNENSAHHIAHHYTWKPVYSKLSVRWIQHCM